MSVSETQRDNKIRAHLSTTTQQFFREHKKSYLIRTVRADQNEKNDAHRLAATFHKRRETTCTQ